MISTVRGIPIAYVRSTRIEVPAVTSSDDLLRAVGEHAGTRESSENTGNAAAATWWLHVEQSDGYVVGRHAPTESTFTLAGTTALDPALLFDGRVFSERCELRISARPGGGITLWRNDLLPDDDRVPAWVAEAVRPLVVDAMLVGPGSAAAATDGGFTRVEQEGGLASIVPVPFSGSFAAGSGSRPRLRIRRHFAWDEVTGRVWVALESLAGYVEGDPA